MTPRFDESQRGKTLLHPKLPQQRKIVPKNEGVDHGVSDETPKNHDRNKGSGNPIDDRTASTAASVLPKVSHSFVICADTQYGMITDNRNWDEEIEYSRKAIHFMNGMHPRPAFCCVCGDLTDMDRSFEVSKGARSRFTMEECDEVQLQQRKDFKVVWSELHEDIALVCLCGNHDVGNRPTKRSMELYRKEFGDDYLAFWSAPNVYNIVLNTTLFSASSGEETIEEMARDQFQWMEERLKEVRSAFSSPHHNLLKGEQPTSGQTITMSSKNDDTSNEQNNEAIIFVFGHHPWFLYDENEEPATMSGFCEWNNSRIPDSYFVIPKERRLPHLDLFRKYGVAASFSGHFHQNLVSETSFGMKMIVTGPLSAMLESTGKIEKKAQRHAEGLVLDEPDTLGVRLVEVLDDGSFRHEFISIVEGEKCK
ncbi:unnamed protein product [Pseudo-nitzschia multistriata]|uniref:Calcineurin-like phosphoesterase domain-containing protein n=1 Tax=Pseudo-nitzschia multistriata TaxID=183589 RepID=A0A448YW98_9STRA|nr:unnamed protein product [Pseudo-nitzschia multistriata]